MGVAMPLISGASCDMPLSPKGKRLVRREDVSRRKDRERYLRLKQQNPAYSGFRGRGTGAVQPPQPVLETVVCSMCQRKRNVPASTLPDDRSSYVCLSCQEARATARATPGG